MFRFCLGSSHDNMAAVLPLGSLLFFLLLARLTFTILFLVPSANCLRHRVVIEKCGNLTFSQDVKNALDFSATLLESGSTFLYILIIFLWSRFWSCNFFRTLYRLPIFWFWSTMIIFTFISVVSIDFSKSNNIVIGIGVSLLLEISSLTFFCCALKFIEKVTVKRSLKRLCSNQRLAIFFYYLYISTLWSYLLRNLSLFTYDTTVLVGKIKRPGKFDHIDKLLLFMNIATRGSFVEFFYSLIFRKPNIPVVCQNVENCRAYDQYGNIGVTDSSGQVKQPLVTWLSPLEQAMREAQIKQ